jgi:drug/metabolite transporter (DMT)-like permease
MDKSSWNIPLILQRMLEITLVIGTIFTVALPFMTGLMDERVINSYFTGTSNDKWMSFTLLELCSIFCWFIAFFLRKLLRTVIKSSPFVHENVRYLKYTSYLCAAAGLVLIVKSIADFTVLSPVVAILAVLASLFCQTLAAVFDKAVRLKDENDLTI